MSESNTPKQDQAQPSKAKLGDTEDIPPVSDEQNVGDNANGTKGMTDSDASNERIDEIADTTIDDTMDENNSKSTPIDEKLETLAAELNGLSSEPVLVDASSKYSGLLLPVLLLIILLVFSGFAYYGWQLFQKVEQLDNSAKFNSRIEALTREITQNQQAIGAAKKDIEVQNTVFQKQLLGKLETEVVDATQTFRSISAKNQQQVDMLQQRVDGHQQRLLSLSTTSREDWMLAEAEYLLKLANQRVLLERTSENAVALLESADQLVGQVSAGTGDAELFAIRKAISRDLAALKLIEPIDREGVYLKLQALAERIDQLPRVPSHNLVKAVPTDSADQVLDEGESGASRTLEDKSLLNRLWHEMKSIAGSLDQYIKIEDATAPANPLIDQHLTQVAALNVRLLIEQAQIGLLKESAIIYSESLNRASEQVQRYYIRSQAAIEFQVSLKQLAKLEVAQPLPDISNSLQLLHAYLRQLHKLQGASEGQL